MCWSTIWPRKCPAFWVPSSYHTVDHCWNETGLEECSFSCLHAWLRWEYVENTIYTSILYYSALLMDLWQSKKEVSLVSLKLVQPHRIDQLDSSSTWLLRLCFELAKPRRDVILNLGRIQSTNGPARKHLIIGRTNLLWNRNLRWRVHPWNYKRRQRLLEVKYIARERAISWRYKQRHYGLLVFFRL